MRGLLEHRNRAFVAQLCQIGGKQRAPLVSRNKALDHQLINALVAGIIAQNIRKNIASGLSRAGKGGQNRLDNRFAHAHQCLGAEIALVARFLQRSDIINVALHRRFAFHLAEQGNGRHLRLFRQIIAGYQRQQALFSRVAQRRHPLQQKIRHRYSLRDVIAEPVDEHIGVVKLLKIILRRNAIQKIGRFFEKFQVDVRHHIFDHIHVILVFLAVFLDPFGHIALKGAIKVDAFHHRHSLLCCFPPAFEPPAEFYLLSSGRVWAIRRIWL